MFRTNRLNLTLFDEASDKRVAGEAGRTTTNRAVIYHVAVSVYAASSRTRIFAFLVNAGSVLRTVGAYHAFRSACRWCTYVIFLT